MDLGGQPAPRPTDVGRGEPGRATPSCSTTRSDLRVFGLGDFVDTRITSFALIIKFTQFIGLLSLTSAPFFPRASGSAASNVSKDFSVNTAPDAC